ncbi:MAG TPA: hypothetical protein VFS43_20230 [Polyangiaceae bacterium]|nr:hypothetical protein [Polyangiaceae bacterium]
MASPPARLGVALLLGASVALAACSKKNEEPTASVPYDSSKVEKKAPGAAAAADDSAGKPSVGERVVQAQASARAEAAMKGVLRWNDPAGWTRNKPSNPMRVAEYVIPKKGKDTENAEMVVNTFTSGPGNTVEANIDRWVRQFEPEGSKEEVVKKDREVKGLKVHTVAMNGTYKGMMMPGSAASKPKEHYRLVGAVVEVGGGLWFFKLTGPEATVKAAEADFDKLLESLRKSDEPAGGAP